MIRLIARIEEQGVVRVGSPEDRRTGLVELAPNRATISEGLERLHLLIAPKLAHLDKYNRRGPDALMGRVVDGAGIVVLICPR